MTDINAIREDITIIIIIIYVEFWSCHCIVKETVWNRSGKVDHVSYKYWCVLQGSVIINMIRNLAHSW